MGKGGHVETFAGAVDSYVDAVGVTVASQTFEQLHTAALPDNVDEVEIVNQGGATVYYQCDDTAATNDDLPILTNSSYTCKGNKQRLDQVQLIAGGNVTVHLIVRIER